MKEIFLLGLVFISTVARAQSISKDRSLFDTSAKDRFIWQQPLVDTAVYPYLRKSPLDNMPIVGSRSKKLRYIFNNQRGFDVYQSWQDNMFMLKPDSTFASKMPVIGRGKNVQDFYLDR